MKERPPRILIAPDKFKGALSSIEICSILKNEIQRGIPDVKVEICPLADGGEGSLEVLSAYIPLIEHHCDSFDPLGRPIVASYYTSGDSAYIELARTSGLMLLKKSEQNPMNTSTFGTGILVRDALDRGMKSIILFLGGSATNDGGIGIAKALGYKFLDKDGKEVPPIGKSLISINKIIEPEISLPIGEITIYCDVNSPPFGPNGAAFGYGKQKGANREEIMYLDNGIKNLCDQIKKFNGKSLNSLEGGGAAGGTAICLAAFYKTKIENGLEFISHVIDLKSKIEAADIIISGEGKLDLQSTNGKVVSGVAEICKKLDKKLWLVVGRNELDASVFNKLHMHKIYSIFEIAANLEDAIKNSKVYLSKIGKLIARDIKS